MADGVGDRRALRPCRPARLPEIDPRRCTGCGRCVAACEPHLLSLEVVHWRKFSVLHDADSCTGCSLCALRCPFDAITMRARAKITPGHGGGGTFPDPDYKKHSDLLIAECARARK